MIKIGIMSQVDESQWLYDLSGKSKVIASNHI